MDNNAVAPHAGAWIETFCVSGEGRVPRVAPHAGAWIETVTGIYIPQCNTVAPHAGAWIETFYQKLGFQIHLGRSPRGSVD